MNIHKRLLKGDFLCDKPVSVFRDDDHYPGTPFSVDLEASINISGDDIYC